jgi:hypothetical protein
LEQSLLDLGQEGYANFLSQDDSSVPEASFMNLPVELRLQIYSYLVPIAKIISGTDKEDPWVPVELGENPCNFALLYTNRQIYNEAVQMFYNSAFYSVFLTRNKLRSFNRDFTSISGLPSGFQYITSLSLTVRSTARFSYELGKDDREHLNMVKELADFFSPSGPGNLQNLDLTLWLGPMFFPFLLYGDNNSLPEPPEIQIIVWESLELNFHSLRKIRVSHSVRMQEHRERYSMNGCPKPALIRAVKKEYFDSLSDEISGCCDNTGFV